MMQIREGDCTEEESGSIFSTSDDEKRIRRRLDALKINAWKREKGKTQIECQKEYVGKLSKFLASCLDFYNIISKANSAELM